MVQIFHLALLHVAGEADVVMGGQQKARAVPLQPFADRGDLLGRRLLLGDNMIEPEHHQGVGIRENALVLATLYARVRESKRRIRGNRRISGQPASLHRPHPARTAILRMSAERGRA